MGLFDKALEKQETKGSERYVAVLNGVRPDFKAELTKIQCNDGNGYYHVGFVLVNSLGDKMHFHRCRNVWLASDGNPFKQSTALGPVPVTSDPIQALEPVLAVISFIEAPD